MKQIVMRLIDTLRNALTPVGRVRLVQSADLRPTGVAVLLELGAGRGSARRAADLLVFGQPMSRILEMTAFATRRALPIDRWLVTGLDEADVQPDVAAKWIASLARRAGSAEVIVVRDDSSGYWRRFEANLQRMLTLEAAPVR